VGDGIPYAVLGTTPKTREGAIEMYNSQAPTFDETYLSWHWTAPKRTAGLLKEYCGKAKPDTLFSGSPPVLDLGCGTGMSGMELQAAGFTNLVGLDVAVEALKQSRAKGVYKETVVGDMECEDGPLPFKDDMFAGIVASGCFSYVHNWDRLFPEICRIAMPGGLVVFTHNSQFWDSDLDGVQQAAAASPWIKLFESDPEDYMPNNPDPEQRAKRIRVFVFQVQHLPGNYPN